LQKRPVTAELTGKLPIDPVARIDLGRRIRIGRPGTPASGRTAADSPETATLDGELAGASRSRAPGHDLQRGKHRGEVRATANTTRGVSQRFARRRRHTVQERRAAASTCSGDGVPVVQHSATHKRGTCGFLTTVRNTSTSPRRRRGNNRWNRRPAAPYGLEVGRRRWVTRVGAKGVG
jgi:hypothetical protein